MLNKSLPRRTFLRGLGTAVALPMLDAMLPSSVLAAAAAKKAPLRMAFFFVPNGMHMPAFRPEAVGSNWQLPATLEPLKNVKEHLTVFQGLSQHNGFALGDGPGDHARSVATFLTGVHPKKTDGADIHAGISVDQVAAQFVGRNTRFPSLELGCEKGAQAGNCDSGYSCAYSSNIAWRASNQPMAKEVDPRMVFERLFGGGGENEYGESRAKRDLYRKSILDFVMDDASRLKNQLGVRDQRKLDEYFTGIREIEQRITMAEKQGAELNLAGVKKPEGIPQDYAEYIRLLGDMMILAFQTDTTRICTFMIANDGSNRPYRMIDIPEGHHDLSHHQGDAAKQEKLAKINKFHMTQFAYILERMKAIQEPNGTMLDNSMIVYGAGLSDGNRHNHDDLPVLLAGKGGGTIKGNRSIKFEEETPMNNLFLSMLDRMQVPCEKLGDSSGRLKELSEIA